MRQNMTAFFLETMPIIICIYVHDHNYMYVYVYMPTYVYAFPSSRYSTRPLHGEGHVSLCQSPSQTNKDYLRSEAGNSNVW